MSRSDIIAHAGGLFSVFAFVHFFVDWVLQTHAEAMAKHNNWHVRARHCAIYTVGFLPMLWFLGWSYGDMAIGSAVLFASHFVEDTYVPVYLWARHIRRVPVVVERGREGFAEWVDTALGKILMIGIDQIVHLAFLFVLVWIDMQK